MIALYRKKTYARIIHTHKKDKQLYATEKWEYWMIS